MQVLTIVLLMICNEQNPGSSKSGTSHNKCSKMPPPTSMHKCMSSMLMDILSIWHCQHRSNILALGKPLKNLCSSCLFFKNYFYHFKRFCSILSYSKAKLDADTPFSPACHFWGTPTSQIWPYSKQKIIWYICLSTYSGRSSG